MKLIENCALMIPGDDILHAMIKHLPCRVTKTLENGNLAILQIVDPEDVPEITKQVRKVPGKIGKFCRAVEAAFRVGAIVYRNAMRDKGPRQGKSREDRRKK